MKKCWYFIRYYECPVCGRQKQYRERRYTKKPIDYGKCVTFEQVYDWCEE